MKLRRQTKCWQKWLGLVFLGGVANANAQDQPPGQGLRWMTLRVKDINAGVEAEGDWEKRNVPSSNQTVTRNSVYVVPTVGLGLQGSFYHPNLFQYDISGQNGIGWQENTLNVPGGGTRSDTLYLQRYHLDVTLLKEQPFRTSFFADKDRTTRDYDFFTRATVDRESFGGRTGYAEGPVPFNISLSRTKEDILSQFRPMSNDEDTLNFNAYNERSDKSRTDVTYTLNDYTRREVGAYTQDGIQHLASLTDQETFGKKDHIKLNSNLQYNQLDATTTTEGKATKVIRPSTIFSDHEHLNLRHSSTLQSDYNYNYNLHDAGTTQSDGHSGSAALRHKLYESLTSTFDVHAQAFSSSGTGVALDSTRYGIGLNENYTKRLGKSARLTLGYGGLYDQEDRVSLGRTIFIVGESHTLNDGAITFLNQPQVDVMSIQVWDATGSVRYRELLDYLVLSHGERTEIKRVVGGQIPNGSSVLIDYSVTSQPSDSFTTVAHQLQVRFDFFNGLLGLYGYMNIQENYGGKTLLLENVNDKVAGVDVSWRWFRAGAEYEDYDSNLTPYTSTRLFQTFTCEPAPNTTFNLDVGQSWRTFTGMNRDLTIHSSHAYSNDTCSFAKPGGGYEVPGR